ncbi:MAG: hypothetical protein OET44_18795 [Gammaproteobacteria bacterium]|nr:hypothetical protein [Gammaproteobacteria bacterium]
MGNSRFRPISYEQYQLTPDDLLEKMAAANSRTTITLSPESSDHRIGTLAGRGVNSMPEMEAWIERALDYGIFGIDIWFFIGMKGQGASDVVADVAYSEKLLKKFRGRRVTPFVGPMIPFLDPASTFFEHPGEHGCRVFLSHGGRTPARDDPCDKRGHPLIYPELTKLCQIVECP